MARKQRQISSLSHSRLFLAGGLIALLGVFGVVYKSYQSWGFELAEHIDEEIVLYAEIQGKDVFAQISEFTKQDISLNSLFGESLDVEASPWFKKGVSVALYDKSEFILAFPSRGTKGAKAFIEERLLAGESVNSVSIQGKGFYTPAYSSLLTAATVDDFVVLGSSAEVLQEHLEKESVLQDDPVYKTLRKNVPRRSFAKVFFYSQKAKPLLDVEKYGPLVDIVTEALPAGMISFRNEKGGVSVHADIASKEGVFADKALEKSPQTLPALAGFVPQDVMFFMNGVDLAYKYDHTKQFLSQFHPQFSILFEGIVKAEMVRLLGPKFDFEEDFLLHLSGQYATVVHGFPNAGFSFISDIQSFDTDSMLSQFHGAVQVAQQNFSTKIESVELPDGTVREELVSVDPQEVSLQQNQFEGVEYFSSQSVEAADSTFSYGVLDRYFVFSTTEEGMKEIISAYKKTTKTLADNSDFRSSVLFNFSPSESYGFVNVAAWSTFFQSLVEEQEATEGEQPEKITFASWLESSIRTAAFSRKVYPNHTIVDFMLYQR